MLLDAVAVAVLAVALYVLYRGGVPSNDSWHTLIWGRELASGQLPDYDVPRAPTPHPLLILYAAVLSPLGGAATAILQLTGMVALGAVAVGLFRLAERLYAWPVGLLATAILLSRDRFLYLGVRGSVDIMTLALIVWAAVLEASRPRRGGPVLALLFVAGVLRPEAWLFAAAYWVWLFPARSWRARIGLGALAAAAPVLWALSDYLVTGDPLWSLHGTQDLAGVLNRPTGLSALPNSTWLALKSTVSPPVLFVGIGGLVAGLAFRARATRLPAAILALGVVAFLGLAIFELPLNSRYLLPAAVAFMLLAAFACLGWSAVRLRGSAKNVWRAAGGVALAFLALQLVWEVPVIVSVREKVVARGAFASDLDELLRTDPVERALARCRPLTSPSNFRRTQLAYVADRREESIRVAEPGVPLAGGVYVRVAIRDEVRGRVNGYGPNSFGDYRRDRGPFGTQIPPGFAPLARSRFWLAYSSCQGPPRPARGSSGASPRPGARSGGG